MGSSSPMGRGNFEGKVRPIVKYRDTVQLAVQKRLNRSRRRLGCGLGLAQGIMYQMVQTPIGRGNFEGKGGPL